MGLMRHGSAAYSNHTCTLLAWSVPTQSGLAAGPAEEAGLHRDRRQMLRAAAELLTSKAIRSQQDIQAGVPGLTGPEADVILPRLAYIFRNGELLTIRLHSLVTVKVCHCNVHHP